MSEREKDDAQGAGCAICGKPRDRRFTPFCSKRCADIDLGRWLGGRYAIAAQEEDEGDGVSSAPDRPAPRLN